MSSVKSNKTASSTGTSKVMAYSATGVKKDAAVALNKEIFGLTANHELVGLAYRAYLANGRQSDASTLTRAMVSGGGKKPWRQKGTGRARAGSSRIPHWRGGGVVFGNTGNENFTIKLSSQMRRQAIKQALSLQAADGKLVVLENFSVKEAKSKLALQILGKLNLTGSILLVVDNITPETSRATNNISGVDLVAAKYLNVFMIMNSDNIVITQPALKELDTWLAGAAQETPKTKEAVDA